MGETNRIFVYGTLRQGFPLHRFLERSGARLLGSGSIAGNLYDLGEFPGALAASDPDAKVQGEVYELRDSDKQLRELDGIEEYNPEQPGNSLFVRRLAVVKLQNGASVRAWTYFLSRKPTNARRLASGDYAEARRSR